jgi:hypothetical protein
MIEFTPTVVDEFTSLVKLDAEINGMQTVSQVDAYTVGYLTGFLNMLTEEFPGLNERIEDRMAVMSRRLKETA